MIYSSHTNSLRHITDLIKAKLELGKSFEKLSSGMKINRASDDPAGLVISEQMRARIGEISQLIRNIEYQNNKYTVAESGLAAMQVNLQEIRNVALAASDEGAVTDDMRTAYQTVVNRNIEGFNNIIKNTSFGTQALLDGSEGSVADIKELDNLDITDPEQARLAVGIIDEKINEILNLRGEIGAKQKYQFGSQKSNLQTELINLTAAESSIRDTDMAREYANMVSYEIKLKAGMSLLAHRHLLSGFLVNIIAR
ncbi:MAG: flagellin [Candidatus Zixiibacteriota bacterium]|nr:MAG: flagellin [candidate division Zixibacteria bacterium]